ncbi:MAG: DedA family protein [Rikenellaceae bacterium]|nr:DedA family protein [Rikenellaceae bacterium]
MEVLLGEWGYIGLFIGSFLAATIVPFSSDVLLVGMLLAGASVWPAVIVATAGNWLGGLTSYYIGYIGKWEWLERWFRVKRSTLERQKSRVDRYGPLLALMTWLPVVGDVFAIALGFYRQRFWPSAAYMLAGKAARFVIWAFFFL